MIDLGLLVAGLTLAAGPGIVWSQIARRRFR